MTPSLESTKDLEGQILGKIIEEPSYIFNALEFGLKPYMFPNYNDIFTEILRRVGNDEAYDLVHLGTKFPPEKMVIITDMVVNAPITLNLKSVMKSLKFFAEQERLMQLSMAFHYRIKEMTIDHASDIDKISGSFVHDLTAKVHDIKSVKMNKVMEKVIDHAEKCNDPNQENAYKPLCTGNNKLDEVLGMHCSAKYITIMAETGVGKSTLAIDIAVNMALRGRKVLYFTQEMTSLELAEKAALMHAGIDWTRYIKNQITDAEYDRFMNAARKLYKLPLFINYAHPNIDEIILESLTMINREGIEAIFIDYIQQLECDSINTYDPRHIMIHVSKKLATFTLEQDIPIFVAAQLNRAAANAHPSSLINNVADSSSISKDTTYGLAVVTETDQNGKEIDRFLYKTKGRHGPRGRLTHLFFDKKSHRYSTDY
jgi:replicative DNA helicase